MPPRKPPPVVEPDEQETPDVPSRERTRSLKKLQASVEGFYIMLGGALSVLPPQIVSPRARFIGLSLTMHASPIADAWIDLAEEDNRVKRVIESLAGFNAWGKVVGEHLTAIGEATPAIANRNQPQAQENPDLSAMMGFAQWMQEQAAAERANGPAATQAPQPQPSPSPEVQQRMRQEQQRQQQRPPRQQQQQPIQQDPPVMSQRRPVGMPSPADLGVTVTDQPEDFPTSGADNVKG